MIHGDTLTWGCDLSEADRVVEQFGLPQASFRGVVQTFYALGWLDCEKASLEGVVLY